MEMWKIIRQDGKAIEVELNKDGTLDWDIQHVKEWYYLNVADGTGAMVCVGIYDDIDTAREDAAAMEQDGVVPYQEISAKEYLEADGKVVTPARARELQGLTALAYINYDDMDEVPF